MARAPLSGPLRSLALAHGVLPSYVAHGGERRHAGAEEVAAVLEALGAHGAAHDPEAALAAHRSSRKTSLLEPVVVLEELASTVPVSVAAAASDLALECQLRTEGGEVFEWRTATGHLDDVVPRGAGRRGRRVALPLPVELVAGYHWLSVATARGTDAAHLLVRPAGGARGRFEDGWRAAGLTAPLFSLHSERSWGCGDLTDLDALGQLALSQGLSVIATLPLLAGPAPAHFEPSPYLPLSRRFWHERWLDVDSIPGLDALPPLASRAAQLAASLRTRADAAHPLVPGASSLEAKWEVLAEMADALCSGDGPLRGELEGFVSDRPGVVEYARFRAAGERFGPAWRAWPTAHRHGLIDAGDVDEGRVRFHSFCQWAVQHQLTDVAHRFERRGQVLMLDLPLGVHPDGFDVWREPEQFVEGVSVGAPPDRFFPKGQSWGFAPPRFAAARLEGHRGFREALRHHLNVARMLRVDHVMGLQRLFYVPQGAEPEQGVYVRSPLEELFAVLAIEAQRHRATIAGEDLGTVDAAVRTAMRRDGVRRTYAVQLSMRRKGARPFAEPPADCVASFSTHDLPTFSGWWSHRDVDERVALGQVTEALGEQMVAERDVDRQRLSRLVDVPAAHDPAPDSRVLDATMTALAGSPAGLVLAQLDDLVAAPDAVNLPGTSVERPNWQRRCRLSLGALATDPEVAARLAPLTSGGRGSALTRGGRPGALGLGVTRLGELDDHLLASGAHARLHHKLGAHCTAVDGVTGTYFAVWAPNASWVEVVGDFNSWDGRGHPLASRGASGVWERFVPGVGDGARYKFRMASSVGGGTFDKADPFARRCEVPPRTASIVWEPAHEWRDSSWLLGRAERQGLAAPISIYELHLASWRTAADERGRPPGYREIAAPLIEHVHRHGFTHVELLPVMEHPFSGSWGYQVTGFFAPTSRFGTPDDFSYLVDELHRAGIGVICDFVPAHFPSDAFALATYDGTHLFEHPDPRQRIHPDWQSLIFDYDRPEVRSFLLSAACSWLDRFHIDGLRFDAVASMLYLDFSRAPGEWVPNRLGGNENLGAIEFLRTCNDEIHRAHPGVLTFAEDSTSWPGVTSPTEQGGLGFDYKWDLGWMHDTLDYLGRDPVHRRWHHDQLTFRSLYATTEQFVLPLSHDEVVHGKGSLFERMPGDDWQRFANVRLLFGFQLAQPGKKLLFMGDEIAQRAEWAHDGSVDWHLLEDPAHAGVAALVARCNELYRSHDALHRDDREDRGFVWVSAEDRDHSVLCVERFDGTGESLVIALNATPAPREGYLVGMPAAGTWALLISSDDTAYGGSGYPVPASVEAEPVPRHGRAHQAALTLPPLGFVIYARSSAPLTEAATGVH